MVRFNSELHNHQTQGDEENESSRLSSFVSDAPRKGNPEILSSEVSNAEKEDVYS